MEYGYKHNKKEKTSYIGKVAKKKALEKASKKDSRHYRTDMETEEEQKKNAELRKGTKRPEHGNWPIAK